jgi:hypothetical protein
MISSTEIDAMRQAVEDEALPDTGLIQRATSVSDGMGGQTKTWATVIASVDCRVSMPTAGTPGLSLLGQQFGDRIANRDVLVASFPALTDVRDGDRLVVGGRTYELLNVFGGSWEIARRAMVVLVE